MEIKNCPFCGGEPVCSFHTLISYIWCDDCGHIVSAMTPDEVTEKWNAETSDCGGKCEIEGG